jgi:hypothetical protein
MIRTAERPNWAHPIMSESDAQAQGAWASQPDAAFVLKNEPFLARDSEMHCIKNLSNPALGNLGWLPFKARVKPKPYARRPLAIRVHLLQD